MILNDISEYASNEDWSELKCILKRLYSDFIVIEIPRDGKILEPKSTDNVCSDEEEKEEKHADVVKLPKELECINEQISKFAQIVEGEIDECIVDLKEFDKDVRKQLYGFIENNYGTALSTDCKDGILAVKKAKWNDPDKRKRKFWPSDRGDYLHFTITKEFMDTNTCIDLIASRLNLKPSLFSVSGSKDRRAITVQRACAYRIDKKRLCRQNFRHLWLSDFTYSKTKLELGVATGNRFSIILRDIDENFNQEEFNNRVEIWKTTGFLNYFGSQRFGACGVQTAEIGRLILNQKWEEAVKALLAPKSDTSERSLLLVVNECLKHFTDSGNAKESLKLLNHRSAVIERSLLVFLSKYSNGYKGALLALPRNVRTMYVHAYQSAVFNNIVSRRKKMFGLKYLTGDLDIEGKVINEEQVNKIENVCLPLPSFENKLPENEVGEWYKQIAKEDGIDYESFKKIERFIFFIFSYKFLVKKHYLFLKFKNIKTYLDILVSEMSIAHSFKKPQDVSWELLNYSFRDEPLQNCEFIPKSELNEIKNEKIKEENEEKTKKAIKLEFTLSSGTYATIALRELMRVDFSKESQKEMELEIIKDEK